MPNLTANTIVVHPETGQPVLLAAEGPLPDWATSLVGDHLLDGSGSAESGSAGDLEAKVPSRKGPGSGAQAWREYATSVGVEVDPEASREDTIAALDKAGKPTE